MLQSIRSILYISFIIVGISLFLVVILGFRQFQLSRQYSEITTLSERTLFTFATIREQVTESLITRDYQLLMRVVPEIEVLNNNISRLYDSDVIPGQYKLAMADKIDLTGLALTLKKIAAVDYQKEAGLNLQRDMRLLSERLSKVDRIITGQIRDGVVGFQLSIIGAMGVFISCASFILIVLYRRAVKPLLDLSEQAEKDDIQKTGFSCQPEAGTEIVRFAVLVNQLLERAPAAWENGKRGAVQDGEILSATVNETANGLNAIINYAQLLLESGDGNQLPEEQKKMLEKIMVAAERIAGQWQKISQRFSG